MLGLWYLSPLEYCVLVYHAHIACKMSGKKIGRTIFIGQESEYRGGIFLSYNIFRTHSICLVERKNIHLHTLRPNKKISVFQVTGLKILGRADIHTFFKSFFLSRKKYNFMHFERHIAFQKA